MSNSIDVAYVADIMQVIVGLVTVLALIYAVKQYRSSNKSTRLRNSLEVLSWFDEDRITILIEGSVSKVGVNWVTPDEVKG